MEPAGDLHNIFCKLISVSDNDLGIRAAEAAVTTLSNHILNYVSLYRKVLQKHTDAKSVYCSRGANHLTSPRGRTATGWHWSPRPGLASAQPPTQTHHREPTGPMEPQHSWEGGFLPKAPQPDLSRHASMAPGPAAVTARGETGVRASVAPLPAG